MYNLHRMDLVPSPTHTVTILGSRNGLEMRTRHPFLSSGGTMLQGHKQGNFYIDRVFGEPRTVTVRNTSHLRVAGAALDLSLTWHSPPGPQPGRARPRPFENGAMASSRRN